VQPAGGNRPVQPGAANRPLAAGAARANAPLPVGNRPIAVKQRKPDDLPEAHDEEDDDDEGTDLSEVAKNAPAWLVSTVFHMIVLIILGVWAVANYRKPELQIESAIIESDRIGDQLEDDSVMFAGPKDQIEKAEKQIITPQNLPMVDDPFATPPEVTDIHVDGHNAVSDVHAPTIGLALTGRQAGMRSVLLGAYGGNALTEGAVGKGLEWLAKQQRPEGTWSLVGPYTEGSIEENQAAATAMALLAFQGADNTHRKGKYAKLVDKAWTALLKMQDRDGFFGKNTPNRQGLYTHAQCSIALCEIYGMTKDSRFYEPAQRAVSFCVRSQDLKGGGWRYDAGIDSDTSVTGWFVMALQSARMAKLDVPQATLDNVSRYLDSAGTADNRYSYTAGTFSTPAVTAEGFLCRQYLGWKQNDQRLIDGVKSLNLKRVAYGTPDSDVYYWYYATQACHHMEGEIWKDWNTAMRQEVPAHQVKSGNEAGSWEPRGDKWGPNVGRLYVTCLSIYMLEVYYRHLPIYSGYKYMAK
jgi:hypothetical protein